jgi:DNA invertase Pin-like site-specific DNA recombinase
VDVEVALYARVSTKDKGQDNENQLVQLHGYCQRQGWNNVAEYVDQASGGTPDRAQFKRMFADARKRTFDVLLFWSLDRLSREGVAETQNHLQRLTSYGVGWKSFTEEYLDSCGLFKDAVIGILAVIAKQERIRRSERDRAAVEKLRAQDRTDHIGRPKKVFNRQRVFDLRATGLSHSEISDRLTAEGVRISKATVQRVLGGTANRT